MALHDKARDLATRAVGRVLRPASGFRLTEEALRKAREEVAALDVVPYYGAALEILARATAHNPRPRGAGAQYDRIKPHFDARFYFACYPDVAELEYDPVWHYIRAGADERRNPSPFFTTDGYRRVCHASRTHRGTPFDHWIANGRTQQFAPLPPFEPAMDRVLGVSKDAIAAEYETRYGDLQNRLAQGELGRMVAKAAEWDAAVEKVWPAAFRMRILPFSTRRITDRISSLHEYQAALNWARAKIVLIDETGSMTATFAKIVNAAVAEVGADQVVIIHTAMRRDETPNDAAIDAGVRRVAIDRQWDRDPADNPRLLVDLLRSLRPATVFCHSSKLFTRALRSYGAAMRACFRVVSFVPDNQTNELGYPGTPYTGAFYRLMEYADVVVCHDRPERRKLTADYLLPDADGRRLIALEQLLEDGGMAKFTTPVQGDAS